MCVIFSFTRVWNLNLKNHHKWVSSQQMEKETLHEDLATDGVSMKAGGDSLGNRILYGVTVNTHKHTHPTPEILKTISLYSVFS